MWIQIRDHDEDAQFLDDASYEVTRGGVLMVTSGDERLWLRSPGASRGLRRQGSACGRRRTLPGASRLVLPMYHLYSPAYWQEVTIDTRSAGQREKQAQQVDEDLK